MSVTEDSNNVPMYAVTENTSGAKKEHGENERNDRYSKILDAIMAEENIPDRWKPVLADVKLYVNGVIESKRLCEGKTKEGRQIIFKAINKILNHEDITYRMLAPQDKYFDTTVPVSIMATRVKKAGLLGDDLEIIGPERSKENPIPLYSDYTVILKGDFSEIPNGAMLCDSDKAKIWGKWPNIKTYVKKYIPGISDEDAEKHIEKHLNSQISLEGCSGTNEDVKPLPQKTIDSISLFLPVKYITLQDVMDKGDFPSFNELVKGKEELERGELEQIGGEQI